MVSYPFIHAVSHYILYVQFLLIFHKHLLPELPSLDAQSVMELRDLFRQIDLNHSNTVHWKDISSYFVERGPIKIKQKTEESLLVCLNIILFYSQSLFSILMIHRLSVLRM